MKGSVSVFLSMSLLLVLSLIFVLAEGTRQMATNQVTKSISYTVGDCMESMYLRPLWKRYGILAVDSTMGSSNRNFGAIEEKLTDCQKYNGDPLVTKGADFLRTYPKKCVISEYGFLTDNGGAPFIRLAAKKEMELVPGDKLQDLMSSVLEGKDGSMSEDNLLSSIESGEEALNDIKNNKESTSDENKDKQQYPMKDWGDTEDPMQTAKLSMESSSLDLFIPSGKAVSRKVCDTSNILEKRYIESGTKSIESPGSVNRLLFNEYLIDNMSFYTEEKQTRGLDYEVEYVIGGAESDEKNLKKVIDALLIFRETENTITIVTSPSLNQEAGSLALAIAGASADPLLVEAVKAGIIAGWAYVESVLDIRAILHGKKVPILKTVNEWTTSLSSLPEALASKMEAISVDKGLSYATYLRFLLYFKSQKNAAYRAMDIMENYVRYENGLENIRMDKMVYAADISMEYSTIDIFPIFVEIKGKGDGHAYSRVEKVSFL